MSIQSIQSNSVTPYFEEQLNLEAQLREAMWGVDVASIKEIVSKGANPNQKVTLNATQMLKLLNAVQEDSFPQLFLSMICKGIGGEMEGSVDASFLQILDALSEGHTFSDEFYAALGVIAKEGSELIDRYIEPQNELSLLSMAVRLRDLDLLALLVESGVDIENNLSKEGDFFDAGLTTQKSIDILNYMVNQGYSLESLLGSEETFEEIIDDAQDMEDELLLSFLKEHGITAEENVEVEDFAQKV